MTSGRIHLKKPRKHSPRSRRQTCFLFFVYSLLASFLATLLLLSFAGRKLQDIIIRYASTETNRIATAILNDTIRNENLLSSDTLYTITKDKDGNIQLIDFNTKVTNDILKVINERATKRLLALERGDTKDLDLSNGLKGTKLSYLKDGVVCEIPLGVLLGNSLVVNVSSPVPIRFSFVGTVTSNMKTKVTSYGLNNALVEIMVEVTIMERVTLPHSTENITVTSMVPLAVELVQGRVPSFYQEGLSKNSSSLSLPLGEN